MPAELGLAKLVRLVSVVCLFPQLQTCGISPNIFHAVCSNLSWVPVLIGPHHTADLNAHQSENVQNQDFMSKIPLLLLPAQVSTCASRAACLMNKQEQIWFIKAKLQLFLNLFWKQKRGLCHFYIWLLQLRCCKANYNCQTIKWSCYCWRMGKNGKYKKGINVMQIEGFILLIAKYVDLWEALFHVS